jgi:hypothetical protein
VLYVSDAFLNGTNFNVTVAEPGGFFEYDTHVNIGKVQSHLSEYETLQNADCIHAYAVELLTNRRTLVLVTTNSTDNDSSLLLIDAAGDFESSYDWYIILAATR